MSHPIHDVPTVAAVAAPGLRVGLSAKTAEGAVRGDSVSVRAHVEDATRPFHLCVYLDGDLVDTCTPASSDHEVVLPALRGRHVVTARAIDAAGRWGGASVLVHGAAA